MSEADAAARFVERNALLHAALGLEAHGRRLDRWLARALREEEVAEPPPLEPAWADAVLGLIALRRALGRELERLQRGADAAAPSDGDGAIAVWDRRILR